MLPYRKGNRFICMRKHRRVSVQCSHVTVVLWDLGRSCALVQVVTAWAGKSRSSMPHALCITCRG